MNRKSKMMNSLVQSIMVSVICLTSISFSQPTDPPWTETDFGTVRSPVKPERMTENITLPVNTHTWYVNLYFNGNNWCDPEYPQMINLIADPFCVHVNRQSKHEPYFTNMELQYVYNYGQGNPHARIAHELSDAIVVYPKCGTFSGGAMMDDYSDWGIKLSWDDGKLEAFMSTGCPFVYFHSNDGGITVKTDDSTHVWYKEENAIGVQVWINHFDNKTQTWHCFGVNNYLIFGPTESTWEEKVEPTGNITFTSDLAGKNYASIATIPNYTNDEQKIKTLKYFKNYAFNFITDTKVDWKYDEKKALLKTTFTATYEKKEESAKDALLYAIYPHQWQSYKGKYAPVDSTYNSARGPMKVIEAANGTFETELPYYGILPHFPLTATPASGYSLDELKSKLAEDMGGLKTEDSRIREVYSQAVILGRTAQMIRIADQAGQIAERDALLQSTKESLENWLSYSSGGDNLWLVYDKNYGALIANPPCQGMFTDLHLNDAHFQFGYMIKAAAIVANYDKEWMKNWGERVELLIRYVSNWKRDDPEFPFLRFMEPYKGHSWATGDADFRDGNNQESSSEALNYASAVALWGMITGNKEIRDLGIYLYTTESDGVLNYWWDINNVCFPNGPDHGDRMDAIWEPALFHYPCLGWIWGDKIGFATWFGSEQTGYQEYPIGINLLPMTAASVYLGRNHAYVKDSLVGWFINKYGKVNRWNELFWEYLALADPAKALEYYKTVPHGASEPSPPSETESHYYHWMHNLAAMGPYNPEIRANTASFAVFGKEKKTYVAYNPTDKEIEVVYTNGAVITVPPGKLIAEDNPHISIKQSIRKSDLYHSLHITQNGGALYVHADFPEKCNLALYDMKGRNITSFTIKKGKGTYPVLNRKISSGLYLLKVTNRAQKSFQRRVVVY